MFSKDDYKFDLPDRCFLIIMKGLKIEKLHKKFALLVHPQPKIEGELIIVQPVKQDQYDTQLIVFRDYSLRKRLQTKPKPKKLSSYQQKKVDQDNKENSKLRCLEIDLKSPLSHVDWKNFAEVIDEVQGLGYVQVLPTGQKSSQPFQFQLMHVLPNKKIPYASLPLDLMITAKVSFLKHQQELQIEEAKASPVKAKLDKKKEDEKKHGGVITLDEFKFPHGIYVLDSSHVKEEALQSAYNKIYTFLDLENHPGN